MLPAISSLCRRLLPLFAAIALTPATASIDVAAQVPTPTAHFGFRLGADRELATADQIEKFFEVVAARSDRVKLLDLGRTTEGHRTVAAVVSAPENILTLDTIRDVNQRLADPRTLTAEEGRRLATTHKTVVAIGAGIHASEVGGSQAVSELLYSLATADDAETLDILRNVVVILIPLLNPDGHRLVVDWYSKTKDGAFEGVALPWLDHKYAGHDINRDAFMMNVAESRNLARFFYTTWHPQVFLSLHQMASDGPRMFVPPVADPIDANYDPTLWREAALLGSAMALELRRDGHSGVISSAIYDYYWPGYEDSAPLGHNTVCLLAETANAKLATPLVLAPESLHVPGGLPADVPQINFPDPWPGGRWALRDIVDYDLSATHGLLKATAAYRERIVGGFFEMGARAIETGRRGGPFAFVIPSDQHDPLATAKLEELLLAGGIEIHRAIETFRAGAKIYAAGTDIILAAQPYRAYVKTLLERQDYPGRRAVASAGQARPYDVAGWTLPAQMGVELQTIERPFQLPGTSRLTSATIEPRTVSGDRRPSYYLLDVRGNNGVLAINRLLATGDGISWTSSEQQIDGHSYPAGSAIVRSSKTTAPVVQRIAAQLGVTASGTKSKPISNTVPLRRARVALYRSWTDNADEGWTRWLFDQFEMRYTTVSDADVRAGALKQRYDVIVLPSAPPEQFTSGNQPGLLPAEYVGGLGDAGTQALKIFVESGGTLICLDQACGFAIAQLSLPVRDVAHEASAQDFYCPGSIIRLDLDPRQSIAYGMPAHTAGVFAFSSAYELDEANPRVRVVARYAAKDLLVSGWLEGEDVIANRAAVAEIGVGSGRVVLLGFPVQHRGQSFATFRLLFNSIFTSAS